MRSVDAGNDKSQKFDVLVIFMYQDTSSCLNCIYFEALCKPDLQYELLDATWKCAHPSKKDDTNHPDTDKEDPAITAANCTDYQENSSLTKVSHYSDGYI